MVKNIFLLLVLLFTSNAVKAVNVYFSSSMGVADKIIYLSSTMGVADEIIYLSNFKSSADYTICIPNYTYMEKEEVEEKVASIFASLFRKR